MRTKLIPLVLSLVVAVPGTATAHLERPSQFPDGTGSVPAYRTTGPELLVCKPDSAQRIAKLPPASRTRNVELLARCRRDGFQHLQAAIDAVAERGTRILMLPGVYQEEPSRAALPAECAPLAGKHPLSYEEQVACPHVENLVAFFGDSDDDGIGCDTRHCDLQIEGTGAKPEDVILDGEFSKLNVLRADRAGGAYFRNFTVQHAEFNALYVMETDGFVIDRMLGRWNDEYAFLTFASDHGLYMDCEAHGNGDGGLYPGSAADLHGVRPAIEITRCVSHHNTLGLSGTAGNSLYVHDNDFYGNSVGVVMDSFFPDHPGLPQDGSTYVDNRIHGNNSDYYKHYRDGTCAKPFAERGYENGVVCPSVPVPVGTGVLVAGGNANTFSGNWIYDNWRYGAMQFWVPAALRNEMDPLLQYDTSHFNRYLDNHMSVTAGGAADANGTDFWWDEEGEGNCWSGNVTALGRAITSDPLLLPACDQPAVFRPGNPVKLALLVPCATWSREDYDPAGCDWFRSPPEPR